MRGVTSAGIDGMGGEASDGIRTNRRLGVEVLIASTPGERGGEDDDDGT